MCKPVFRTGSGEGEFMKIIALYLPQFHAFPENDEWWGKGYTEWTAVRSAKPLFRDHIQPRHPLDGYYDLAKDQPETFLRQAGLAKEYGIYGFAFYQYYFTGKTLMERPLNILLEHPEVDIKYCLAWANETWTRAWYGLKEEILMPQEYGGEREWREHFLYELKFFKDERYIKIGNKPVFMIYRTFDIDCLPEMKEKWDSWAREEGFDGIYWIGGKTAGQEEVRSGLMDGWYYFEPGYTLKHGMSKLCKLKYNTGTLLRNIRNRFPWNGNADKKVLERRIPIDWIYSGIAAREYGDNEYPGIITEWDNTPRRSYKGLVYTGASPQKFREVLCKLKSKTGRDSFVFLNAWNEWGEGAMIEPTEEKGYAYLSVLRELT